MREKTLMVEEKRFLAPATDTAYKTTLAEVSDN